MLFHKVLVLRGENTVYELPEDMRIIACTSGYLHYLTGSLVPKRIPYRIECVGLNGVCSESWQFLGVNGHLAYFLVKQ
jgi:hypothetical protein